MSRIEQVVEQCLRIASEPGVSEERKKRAMREAIGWFAEDALKLARNISETSAGLGDRFQRLLDFEKRMGISKSSLL